MEFSVGEGWIAVDFKSYGVDAIHEHINPDFVTFDNEPLDESWEIEFLGRGTGNLWARFFDKGVAYLAEKKVRIKDLIRVEDKFGHIRYVANYDVAEWVDPEEKARLLKEKEEREKRELERQLQEERERIEDQTAEHISNMPVDRDVEDNRPWIKPSRDKDYGYDRDYDYGKKEILTPCKKSEYFDKYLKKEYSIFKKIKKIIPYNLEKIIEMSDSFQKGE
jgi:hypothetical protein